MISSRALFYGLALLASQTCVQEPEGESPRGYVLKAGEGESVGPGLVKASANSGTRSIEVVMSNLPAGAYTGIHIHTNADEFFYILDGNGTIQIDGVTYVLDRGDFAFIPIGVEHEVKTDTGLEMLEIVDGPARVEFMREVAARPSSNRMSLEECNEIGARHGVICITN